MEPDHGRVHPLSWKREVDLSRMEIFEILMNRLYKSGAPENEADWQPIHERNIDVVVDLYGTLDPGVPTAPASILYLFRPIEDTARLPNMTIMTALTDVAVRLMGDEHQGLVHCHEGKKPFGGALTRSWRCRCCTSTERPRSIPYAGAGRGPWGISCFLSPSSNYPPPRPMPRRSNRDSRLARSGGMPAWS